VSELISVAGRENETRAGDVIFVHGLGGHPVKSWASNGETATFWPEWLGNDLPTTRIWSFGYEAEASLWNGDAATFEEIAVDFLMHMTSKGLGDRPIIFITDGTGGILVKYTLRRSRDYGEVSNEPVAAETAGVCFIATPHYGFQLATLYAKMGWLTRPTDQLLESRVDNYRLIDINDWYKNYCIKNSVNNLVFYERKRVKYVGILVDKATADPGIPESTVIPVREDNFKINRITSPSDTRYRLIYDFIYVSVSNKSKRLSIISKSKFVRDMNRGSSVDDLTASCVSGQNPMDRGQLVKFLWRLSPPDFVILVAMIPDAASRTSRLGTVPEQAAELLRWAESSNGPGLPAVEKAIHQLRHI
jgi:hypothetical protein